MGPHSLRVLRSGPEVILESDRSELRWGVKQRLEFIEFRLFW
ncbi:WYL domain-containing protein, partial [Escherichia coli]|nr:WYL domain-containing protein [Escherichia coli]